MKQQTVNRLVTTMFLLGITPVVIILGGIFGVAEACGEVTRLLANIWK